MDIIRFAIDKPIVPTNWCRCEDHNKAVGGSPNSQHLQGNAVNIPCLSDTDRGIILEAAVRNGIKGIGIGKTFLHLDVRPSAEGKIKVWVYPLGKEELASS